MPAPLAPEKRDAILASLRAGMTRNRAAREHHVSFSTVSKIAAAEGVSFDRSQTKKATEAARIDHQATLTALVARSGEICASVFASFESMETEDWQRQSLHSRAILAGIFLDKIAEEARLHSAEGTSSFDEWLVIAHGTGKPPDAV